MFLLFLVWVFLFRGGEEGKWGSSWNIWKKAKVKFVDNLITSNKAIIQIILNSIKSIMVLSLEAWYLPSCHSPSSEYSLHKWIYFTTHTAGGCRDGIWLAGWGGVHPLTQDFRGLWQTAGRVGLLFHCAWDNEHWKSYGWSWTNCCLCPEHFPSKTIIHASYLLERNREQDEYIQQCKMLAE